VQTVIAVTIKTRFCCPRFLRPLFLPLCFVFSFNQLMQASVLNDEILYASLSELAMDLHWTWDHATDKIWRQLDPVLWELTHNPLVVLQTVSRQHILAVCAEPLVQELIQELTEARRQHALSPAWFQHRYAASPLSGVAYFSMEFMLSEALPIYSGGLGNVAGDHLKTASDLGLPLTGIGLLYQQGYSRQVVYPDGLQQYAAPYNDPGQLPVTPLRDAAGEWLRIEVKLPGYSVWLRTWQVQVGRVRLLLLDSNDAANFPIHRGITAELYGSDATLRFFQELILGIGGWRLLKALGMKPEVCHLNEGHAAFVVVERAYSLMEDTGLNFGEALTIARSGNVFTTHTAVGAGFDVFPPLLVEQYLGNYIQTKLRISMKEFLALGRANADDESEGFNTAYLAMRGSAKVNGVSRLHSKISRRVFSAAFPRWPVDEVPIGHVTNGVHMPTWDAPEADKLWTEACGKDRWLGTLRDLTPNIRTLSDSRLWQMRCNTKNAFAGQIRNHYRRQLATVGATQQAIEEAATVLDSAALTIGFARRFAAYKRLNLLLQDKQRLKTILTNEALPVQLVIAGKAHRSDAQGQTTIREWMQFIASEGLHRKIIFLSDYDMHLCEHLVQGVDLWLNTPRRPWEACGTSGMKVLVNGGLNCAVLDGWWDEGYTPAVGWAIGQQAENRSDENDAQCLYNLLENEIIPLYYLRNAEGTPMDWIAKVRESMAVLTPAFSANRSVREYTENYYLPAAAEYQKRVFANGEKGVALHRKKTALERAWKDLRFGEVTVTAGEGSHFICVQVIVILNSLCTNDVRAELYANGVNGNDPERHEMNCEQTVQEHPLVVQYGVTISTQRPVNDYTPRILPCINEAALPLECPLVLWQR
jgi:glycogen phosphorylase